VTMLAFLNKRRSVLISMSMLYFGKASGLLITLFFIPFFHKTMGSEVFGYVAIVLSMQALLTTLDFGLSTVVSREFSAMQLSEDALKKLFDNAVLALLLFYCALLIFGILTDLFILNVGISAVDFVISVVFFLCMVLQNLYYSATMSSQNYRLASAVLVGGNVARAVFTACALKFISPSFTIFVLSQAVVAVIHFFVAKHYFDKSFYTEKEVGLFDWNLASPGDAIGLLKNNKALAMYALAGAAVMQLDKPIIASFIGPSQVSAYYLAMTFCLVPASILAAPVSQFFQPRVVNLFFEGGGNVRTTCCQVRNFALVLGSAVIFPTLIQWVIRPELLKFWLHDPDNLTEILQYVDILLPGVTIGAVGYIPLALLLAAKDYAFQAKISVLFTVATLLFALWAASGQNLIRVCFVYSCYHALSTIVLWLRASQLPLVGAAAKESGIIVAAMSLTAIFLSQILNSFQ